MRNGAQECRSWCVGCAWCDFGSVLSVVVPSGGCAGGGGVLVMFVPVVLGTQRCTIGRCGRAALPGPRCLMIDLGDRVHTTRPTALTDGEQDGFAGATGEHSAANSIANTIIANATIANAIFGNVTDRHDTPPTPSNHQHIGTEQIGTERTVEHDRGRRPPTPYKNTRSIPTPRSAKDANDPGEPKVSEVPPKSRQETTKKPLPSLPSKEWPDQHQQGSIAS